MPAGDHQARGFAPRKKARITGHLPNLAEHAPGRLYERKVHVGADIEDAHLERRGLLRILDEGDQVVFLARIERAPDDPAAMGLDFRNQRRELVALAAARKGVEAFGGEFFAIAAPM